MSFSQEMSSNGKSKTMTLIASSELNAPRKRKQPTITEGWKHMSEESIHKMINQLDADEVAKQASSSSTQNSCQFTLIERQKNWMSQVRQRVNGRIDKFYYHRMSNWVFRSKIEATNFILYETYPKKSKRSNKDKSQPFGQKDKSNYHSNEVPLEFEDGLHRMPLKRERETSTSGAEMDSHFIASCPNTRQSVEEFLYTAYRNLQNMFNGRSAEEDLDDADKLAVPENSGDEDKLEVKIAPLPKNEEQQIPQGNAESMNEEGREDIAMETLDEDFSQIPLGMDFDSLLKSVYENILR